MANFFICPICGSELPLEALFCPHCGSDEQTGWSEDTMYDGLDLPEELPPLETEPENLTTSKQEPWHAILGWLGILMIIVLLRLLLS